MRRAYRIALFCGALPLVVGVSIFLLWLITRWNWLMMAGLFTLYGGVAISFIGIVSLALFCWLAYRAPERPRRLWISTFACAALLFSHFPAAAGIIATVIAIETRYTVVVHNASQQPLGDVRVFGGGCVANFGTIPPGSVARRSFWIQGDGELKIRAVSGTTAHAKVIDGYVTQYRGGRTTVTINSDGSISVSPQNR